jgi:hypothetical protein
MARCGDWKNYKAVGHSRKQDQITRAGSARLFPYFRQFPRGDRAA